MRDYDEAIEYFIKKLRFELKEDTIINETKRWIRVAPPGAETGLLLAKASTEEQKRNVGNQTSGRVAFFSTLIILIGITKK